MYKELNSDIVKFVKFSQESDKSLDRRTLGLNVVQSCCFSGGQGDFFWPL